MILGDRRLENKSRGVTLRPVGKANGNTQEKEHYLFTRFLDLHRHRAVVLVLLEHAEVADAHLVCLTEQLHGLPMHRAFSCFKVPDGVQELVVPESCSLQVGLEVQLAEGSLAHQAGLHGLLLVVDAGIAQHVLQLHPGPRPGCSVGHLVEGGSSQVPGLHQRQGRLLHVPHLPAGEQRLPPFPFIRQEALFGIQGEEGLPEVAFICKGEGGSPHVSYLSAAVLHLLRVCRVHAEVGRSLLIGRLHKLNDGPLPVTPREEGALDLPRLQRSALHWLLLPSARVRGLLHFFIFFGGGRALHILWLAGGTICPCCAPRFHRLKRANWLALLLGPFSSSRLPAL